MDNTRDRKMTSDQMERMLELIEQKPELAASGFTSSSDRSKLKEHWDEAAGVLNSEYGAVKTGEKWQKAWTDWKSKTRSKVRQLSSSGDSASVKTQLNAVELKLISILDTFGWMSMSLDDTGEVNLPVTLDSPRDRKMSVSQMETLIDLIKKSPELGVGRARASEGRERARRAWSKVALTLNADTNGPTKTGEKWQKAWIDWKSKTRLKMTKLQQKAAKTSNKQSFRRNLTTLEYKLASVMGWLDTYTADDSEDDDRLNSPASLESSSECSETPEAEEKGVEAAPTTAHHSHPHPAVRKPRSSHRSSARKRRRTNSARSEEEEGVQAREFLQLERQKVAALRGAAEALCGLRADLQRYFNYFLDESDERKNFVQL